MGSSPRQAKIRRAVEYIPTRTDNNECRRCTVQSYLTFRRATYLIPGTRSTPEASFLRKEWSPQPDRFSVDSGPLSSLVTWNRTDEIFGEWSGTKHPPQPTETAQGGRGQPWRSGGWISAAGGITGSHEACDWVINRFCEPEPRQRENVEAASDA